MRNILEHICSIKEICNECPFRKTVKSTELIRERNNHIVEMGGDLLYRVPCRSDRKEYDDGNQPFCRGAAVYMLKKGKPNAVLKLAIDEGILDREELMRESDLVID